MRSCVHVPTRLQSKGCEGQSKVCSLVGSLGLYYSLKRLPGYSGLLPSSSTASLIGGARSETLREDRSDLWKTQHVCLSPRQPTKKGVSKKG